MNILITAGNTMTMIDQVRGITNIFKGRTGFNIAISLLLNKHEITFLTSNPEIVDAWKKDRWGNNYEKEYPLFDKINVVKYRTYDELYANMKGLITTEHFDVIIHSAAVSDYKVEGTYVDSNSPTCLSHMLGEFKLTKIDASSKIGSDHNEIYLKLIPTEKIVDRIREWGFKGILVKFKLQVGISDKELIKIAEKSRKHSNADLIVANTLEGSKSYAYILDGKKQIRVDRFDLPRILEKAIIGIKK